MRRLISTTLLITFCVSLAMVFASNSYAQTYDPQIDSSRIEEQLPQEFRYNTAPSTIEIPMIKGFPSLNLPEEDSEAPRFRVDKIILMGGTAFDNALMQKKILQAIGKEISLRDLEVAASNITKLYRDEGYVFSSAFIPPQTLKDNTVVIEIVEGYVGEVEYRGISVPEISPIHRYARRLSEHSPVTREELERYILLINDLSGVQAKVITAPVEGKMGAVKLVFLIDKDSHSINTSISNRGSNALGPVQMVTSYQANDLSGLGENTRLIHMRTPTNNELAFSSLSQSWPIGADGGMISYSLRRSDAEPGGQATAFDITSSSNSASLSYYYPWYRTRLETISTTFYLDMRNSSTESFDTEIVDDHLRYVRAEVAYRLLHDGGITNLRSKLSLGLDVWNSTKQGDLKASRIGGSGDANKWQFDVSRYQALNSDWSITFKADGQWAWDPVLSAELFGIGGTEYGRAFDFSTVTGDSGYAASAQLTYAVPKFPHEMIQSINVYGFVDGGQVFDEANVTGSDWKGLASTGIGADVSAFDYIYGKLEVAKPLQTQGNIDHSIEAYGTIGFKVDF